MRLSRLPHYIVGDLDSIRAEVRAFYAANGVEILHRPSQDAHDFNAFLQYISFNVLGGSLTTTTTHEKSRVANEPRDQIMVVALYSQTPKLRIPGIPASDTCASGGLGYIDPDISSTA